MFLNLYKIACPNKLEIIKDEDVILDSGVNNFENALRFVVP